MRFKNGFFVGLQRMHCNHILSRGFVLASYHRPDSITWRWAVSWYPHRRWTWPNFVTHRSNVFFARLAIPLIGEFSLNTQQHMFKKATP